MEQTPVRIWFAQHPLLPPTRKCLTLVNCPSPYTKGEEGGRDAGHRGVGCGGHGCVCTFTSVSLSTYVYYISPIMYIIYLQLYI